MFLPTDRFDYENVDFANDLSAGVPVSGEAPLAGSTPPESALRPFDGAAARLSSVKQLRGASACAFYARCPDGRLLLVEIFWRCFSRLGCAAEGGCARGRRASEVRPTGDVRDAGGNDTFGAADAKVPGGSNASCYVGAIPLTWQRGGGIGVYDSAPHSYNRVPLEGPYRESAAIGMVGGGRRAFASTTRPVPPGSDRPPSRWAIGDHFLNGAIASYINTAIAVNADDIRAEEPLATATPDSATAEAVDELLVSVLDFPKRQQAARLRRFWAPRRMFVGIPPTSFYHPESPRSSFPIWRRRFRMGA